MFGSALLGFRNRTPQDLSGNLPVQLGNATEGLNRQWFTKMTGQAVAEVQRQVFHPVHRWMAATLDGKVEGTGAIFEAKFMLPWSFSEEAAAEKHMAQLQHNTWVTAARSAVLSIITGAGGALRQGECRSVVPAPFAHRREEVLALRSPGLFGV